MNLKSDAFKGISVAFSGNCSGFTPDAAAKLAVACGATVHRRVCPETDVMFSGGFTKRHTQAAFENFRLACDYEKVGVNITVVNGFLFQDFLTGELSLDDFLVNPLLPPRPLETSPYGSQL